MHLLTNDSSEWVPSEWVQTTDTNITIIHTTPDQCYQSPLSIIFISPVKVISSESGEKYALIKNRLQAKSLNKCHFRCEKTWKKG